MTSTFPNGFSLVNISSLLYPNIAIPIELVLSVTKIYVDIHTVIVLHYKRPSYNQQ
jgi:hypothetical protein